MAEWLARVTAGDDVHRLYLVPINLCDVPEVWHTGVMGFQDSAGCRFDLGVPCEVAVDSHV
jgi:hypothetical protein